jgi:hypothetical protein
MWWSDIHEPIVSLLEKMIDMPEDIRTAAIEVADACGRYNPSEFREVWEKLSRSGA